MRNLDLLKLSKGKLIELLELPDHLRKTMIPILASGEATAKEIAKRTGRARAVESSYLNQLERMGFLKRERRGRTVYFSTYAEK